MSVSSCASFDQGPALALERQIRYAIRQEENESFERLLPSLSVRQINRIDDSGKSCLSEAVFAKNVFAIERLVAAGADIHICEGDKNLLHKAVEFRDPKYSSLDPVKPSLMHIFQRTLDTARTLVIHGVPVDTDFRVSVVQQCVDEQVDHINFSLIAFLVSESSAPVVQRTMPAKPSQLRFIQQAIDEGVALKEARKTAALTVLQKAFQATHEALCKDANKRPPIQKAVALVNLADQQQALPQILRLISAWIA